MTAQPIARPRPALLHEHHMTAQQATAFPDAVESLRTAPGNTFTIAPTEADMDTAQQLLTACMIGGCPTCTAPLVTWMVGNASPAVVIALSTAIAGAADVAAERIEKVVGRMVFGRDVLLVRCGPLLRDVLAPLTSNRDLDAAAGRYAALDPRDRYRYLTAMAEGLMYPFSPEYDRYLIQRMHPSC